MSRLILNKKLIILLFFLNVCFADCYAQWRFPDEKIRTVHVISDTGTIEAAINTDRRAKGNPDKTYHWFGNNAIHVTQGGHAGYLLEGKYVQYYYPEKTLFAKGYFKKGVRHGDWIYWYPNGHIKETASWKKGQRCDSRCLYDEDGEIVRIEKYKKGKICSSQDFRDGIGQKPTLFIDSTRQSGKIISFCKEKLLFVKERLFTKKKPSGERS